MVSLCVRMAECGRAEGEGGWVFATISLEYWLLLLLGLCLLLSEKVKLLFNFIYCVYTFFLVLLLLLSNLIIIITLT